MPSPIQTNWRICVRDPRTGTEGVYFLTTATDNVLVALGARLLAEAMPMHLLRRADVRPGPDVDTYHVWLDAGSGTAPMAEALLQRAEVITALIANLRAHYVFPAVAQTTEADLRQQLAAGIYESATTAQAF